MTEDNLYIALVQCDLSWENAEANRRHLTALLTDLPEETDLVVFPEMFATGFSMKVDKYAESMDGQTVQWMKELAVEKQATISGSLMIKEGSAYFNRFVFVRPDGTLDYYDKRHLFSMGEENNHFSPGMERKILAIKSFRILPSVCYDLRFPVFSRNRQDYDLLINTANWPASRRQVWDILLKARAIENQSYVAGINRVGVDGNGIKYLGDSLVIDPKGKPIITTDKGQEQVICAKLSKQLQDKFRRSFPVLPDGDDFQLR